MQDKNLYWKLALIVLVVVWGVFVLWHPEKALKGGIDLAGGYSLLYEIDTTGLDDTGDLSTKVMQRLKQRVDPDGVRNLVWRPVGDTRLEIQMPLPPQDTINKRKTYQDAVENLRATNVNISEVEQALSLGVSERQAQLTRLVRSVPAREKIFQEITNAYDAWQKATAEKKERAILDDLTSSYEAQLDKLLATNINLNQLNEALEMQASERSKELQSLLNKYPERKALINVVVDAYDNWSNVKGPLDDPADLERLLRGAGVLEFHILAASSSDRPEEFSDYLKRLKDKGPRTRPEDEYAWYEIPKPETIKGGGITRGEWGGKTYVLAYAKDQMKVLNKARPDWKLSAAYRTQDQTGLPAVGFEFNEVGASYFLELTRNNIGQPLCILLDDKAYSAPVIRSAISGRGIIEGKFSLEEVDYLVSTLNAGSLDARLKDTPISKNSIGPSLGQDNRDKGLRAAKWGLFIVVVFMLVYYMQAGAIADFALFLNLLLLLAVMAALQATFTMAGIAGLILTMGMAVDANVLIHERMREEKEKLQSLRLIIKNGFDRALPTIIDSNVTTIISCVILYYVGTEEIKGFALTLGLGLVINIFTAVFVTKIIFNLLANWGVMKTLPMLHLFKRPNINWMNKQKYFWAVSLFFVVIGLVTFPLRGPDKYDIEFRGGTSIQIETKKSNLLNIEQVREQVKKSGQLLMASAQPFQKAELSVDPQQKNIYLLKFKDVSATRVDTAIVSFMEDQIEKGSIDIRGADTLAFKIRPERKLTQPQVVAELQKVGQETYKAGQELRDAQVQSIGTEGKEFEIVTTASSQRLVVDAIVASMGQYLNIQQAINYNPDIKTFPVTKKRLGENIQEPKAPGYVPEFLGGAAFVVDKLDPAVTIKQLKKQIVAMRLQPDFEKLAWRQFEMVGLTSAPGQDVSQLSEDQIKYTRVAMVVADPSANYEEDEAAWRSTLVTPELKLLGASLSRTSELQKVTQFAAQVARQTKLAALLALLMSFAAVTFYLWVRFGTLQHGIAANIATLHDIITCLGFVMISAWVANTSIGQALLVHDFKLNLTIVAAFLTLIGYSVNDTIIVFDRIRENQGRLKEMTPTIINNSINQTLSRTVLTSSTVLMVMIIMYIFGGEGAQGFCYVMLLGSFFGCYSSVAIASPLLLGMKGAFGYKGAADVAVDKNVNRGA
ncbi:MAG: protein translocase subunit SecD [Phycisphaerae bacterium]